jgi:hypothetical protein
MGNRTPDFDSAWDAAEERIEQSYKGPFIIQALQLIADPEPVLNLDQTIQPTAR